MGDKQVHISFSHGWGRALPAGCLQLSCMPISLPHTPLWFALCPISSSIAYIAPALLLWLDYHFFSQVSLLDLSTLCFSFFLSIFPSTCAGDYLLAPDTFCIPVCSPCQLEGAGSLKLTLQRVPDTFAGPLSRCTYARCLEGRRGSHITQGS